MGDRTTPVAGLGFGWCAAVGAAMLVAGLRVAAAEGVAGPMCDRAAQGASAAGVPVALLRAIERVESAGHPWTVDVDGAGRRFDSKNDAIEYARAAALSGARFVDVGCFQIDLHYHPDVAGDLAALFDPAANAAVAARFLVALRGSDPGWDGAVAAYHSSDPARGRRYRDLVLGGIGDAEALATAREPRWVAGVEVVEPGMAPSRDAGLPRVFVP